MSTSTVTTRLSRVSRAQLFWTGGGLAVIILVVVIARGNLTAIYRAQPDFVVGSMLSFTGFCFAKASSRSDVTSAVELIQKGESPQIASALDAEVQRRMHAAGTYQQVALLRRNISAANERALEFYDLQARAPRFYIAAPLLRVVLQDLDEALDNLTRIDLALGTTNGTRSYVIDPNTRSKLVDALRDLHEAAARRNETYEALRAQVSSTVENELWGAFTVMTSDTLKALRDLEALLGKNVISSPKERLVVLEGYISASIKRAGRVEQLIAEQGLDEPAAMRILLEDLGQIKEKLSQISMDPIVLAPQH